MFRSNYLEKKFMPNKNILIILHLIGLSLFAVTSMYGQGNLLVSPKRLVFDGNKKNLEINLANTGTDTSRYLVSIMEIRMKEDGSFEEIKEPDAGQNFSSKYLRFFPRSVSLGPNEAQTIKVQLVKADKLAPGEYRSHIYFRAIPKEKPLGENAEQTKDSSIVVKLTPVFGITIPAIIRVGESNTKVNFTDAAFNIVGDTIPRINMSINRTGNMSTYGNILVDLVANNGTTTQVGSANGVAVYTPNTLRRFAFDLDKSKKINYHSGKLHVTYQSESADNPVKLAEYDIPLH